LHLQTFFTVVVKILLVNPPRSPFNAILEHAPEEARKFIHKKLIGPPLGLLTLAASLKDHDVMVFDTKGEYDLNPDTPALPMLVEQLITEFQPDIVGTTVISSEFYYGLEILATAKKINPDILTIIGGLHVTLCVDDCAHPAVDIAVRGHAGYQMREIVRALESRLSPESVPGIYLNTPEGLCLTKGDLSKWNPAGENFLMPDRRLLSRWKETYRVPNAPSPTTYLFSSLGCPYQCSFCSIWREYCGAYLQRDVESIIPELKQMDYDIVRFADANTIVDVDFIDRLFTRIEEEGIEKEYIMDIRADMAVQNPELMEKLARNGLKVVICGFESYKEADLKKYNKQSSPDMISKAISIFHDNGINLRGNYVIPVDYSKEDFIAMADYAAQHKVAYAGYTILTPMPGTVYFDEVNDSITDRDLRKYNFFNPVLPTTLQKEEFCREVGKLWLIKKGSDVI
jgi:hopanoid C-3 methylase